MPQCICPSPQPSVRERSWRRRRLPNKESSCTSHTIPKILKEFWDYTLSHWNKDDVSNHLTSTKIICQLPTSHINNVLIMRYRYHQGLLEWPSLHVTSITRILRLISLATPSSMTVQSSKHPHYLPSNVSVIHPWSIGNKIKMAHLAESFFVQVPTMILLPTGHLLWNVLQLAELLLLQLQDPSTPWAFNCNLERFPLLTHRAFW